MVTRSSEILLRVWREVSRHLEMVESIGPIAELLGQSIPLGRLLIRRCEVEHQVLRLVAMTPADGPGAVVEELRLDASGWGRVERWLKGRRCVHAAGDHARSGRWHALLEPAGTSSDWLIAPLIGEHGSTGIVTAVAADGRRFGDGHLALLESLQEPLGVALDNDARQHSIAVLRAAAEADRRSLLHRLGRSTVSDTIVGDDAGLRQVMQRVEMVSRSDVPVLILGETGTGKELVARAIHTRSDRHDGPFIRVNCGAIPRELIDSQLFGHERGSFTGAIDTRQGWFERADMGTLFLDEIGELPLDAQVRLLRVLQDGIVERIGGSKSIRVHVRLVAATHRDLASMVRESAFREDLWYRIAVFPILLPPLRERRDDIPALARHFAERAAVRFGLTAVAPSDADVLVLQSYDWPGNIRELGAVIDRAAILGNGHSLELAAALGLAAPSAALDRRAAHREADDPSPPVVPLAVAMRSHIEAALRRTRGRVEGAQGAADLLRINPHTLRARMRKLGIDWTAFRPQ